MTPLSTRVRSLVADSSVILQTMRAAGPRARSRLCLIAVATCGLLAAPWKTFAAPGDDTPSGATSTATALTRAEERMKHDVTFLAADAQEGRAPGTKGIEVSADYIASVFKKAGLKHAPGADGYFQPFFISAGVYLKKDQFLVFNGPEDKSVKPQFAGDFTPLAIGTARILEKVPVVFAGYGITAKNSPRHPGLDYDDYAGVDVKDKAVLILRREPQQHDEASPFEGKKDSTYATFQHKAVNAFQHGAAAVILVNNLAGLDGAGDRVLAFSQAGVTPISNIPFLMMTRDQADKFLKAAGEPSLEDLEKQIDSDLKPRSREIPDWTLTAKIYIEGEKIETKNVVGVLEGAGLHAKETVIIGGHYDHLGRGGMLSGSLAIFSKEIHNGADDNASGTSMVLELARRLAARPDPLPRRVVFMAFSGEERGLLGSQYYVNHPLIPLDETVMMINCDMVGRMSSSGDLTMVGTGTTPGIGTLVDALGQSAGLKVKKVAGLSDGFGGSDHESFYNKGVPVLFAFTGLHGDYHRPSDDSYRINYIGMGRIADYLELITLDIARRPERPSFLKLAEARRQPAGGDTARRGTSVSLGIMPDYAYEKKDGLRITGVRDGGPADKAGLKDGDRIVRCGSKQVGTIYDYMESMTQFKPGDKLDLVVIRDGEELKLQATLGGRPAE
jgi:Peptidase family M28/PDZ domain/PA domain